MIKSTINITGKIEQGQVVQVVETIEMTEKQKGYTISYEALMVTVHSELRYNQFAPEGFQSGRLMIEGDVLNKPVVQEIEK